MLLFDPTSKEIRWAFYNEKIIEGTISAEKVDESELEPLIKSCNTFGYVLPNGGNEFIQNVSLISGKDINRLKKCKKFYPEANQTIIDLIESIINKHQLSHQKMYTILLPLSGKYRLKQLLN